jgi:hypothetical protein
LPVENLLGRKSKVGAVKEIEEFGPKLDAARFSKCYVLRHGNIEGRYPRNHQVIFPQIALEEWSGKAE